MLSSTSIMDAEMVGRPKQPLVLEPGEREQPERWSRRPKPEQGLATRSRIVPGCGAGLDNSEVASELGSIPRRPASDGTAGSWSAVSMSSGTVRGLVCRAPLWDNKFGTTRSRRSCATSTTSPTNIRNWPDHLNGNPRPYVGSNTSGQNRRWRSSPTPPNVANDSLRAGQLKASWAEPIVERRRRLSRDFCDCPIAKIARAYSGALHTASVRNTEWIVGKNDHRDFFKQKLLQLAI